MLKESLHTPLTPVHNQLAGKSVSFYLNVLHLHTDNRITRMWQLFIILCTALARRDLWLQSWVRPYGIVFAACEDHAATQGKTNLESHVRMVWGLPAAKPDTGRQFGAKVQRVRSDAQNPLHSWTQHSSANLQLQNDDNMYTLFNEYTCFWKLILKVQREGFQQQKKFFFFFINVNVNVYRPCRCLPCFKYHTGCNSRSTDPDCTFASLYDFFSSSNQQRALKCVAKKLSVLHWTNIRCPSQITIILLKNKYP